ncbi:hypothetical protein QE439_003284 [Pedobacter agri]|nr:hypothetical protein [Pedobacter agri]
MVVSNNNSIVTRVNVLLSEMVSIPSYQIIFLKNDCANSKHLDEVKTLNTEPPVMV